MMPNTTTPGHSARRASNPAASTSFLSERGSSMMSASPVRSMATRVESSGTNR